MGRVPPEGLDPSIEVVVNLVLYIYIVFITAHYFFSFSMDIVGLITFCSTSHACIFCRSVFMME